MKFLLPLIFMVQAHGALELTLFTECSDPAANIVYEQLPGQSNLFVTTINTMTGLHEKVQLKDFSITVDQTTFLEERNVIQCGQHIVNVDEELNYRKIRIFNKDGSKFPGNILGVSADKTFIPVDYLCKTTRISECL